MESRVRVVCPGCGTSFPLVALFPSERDRPLIGKEFSVVCTVCKVQFDAEVLDGSRRWFGIGPRRKGVEARLRR